MTTYKQNKLHNEKWRKNNKQKFQEYQRAWIQRKRLFNKIKMEFLSILLE